MSLGKPTIKLVFMDDDMRDFAVNEATKALETSNSEKVSFFLTIHPGFLFTHNNGYRLTDIFDSIASCLLHEDVV